MGFFATPKRAHSVLRSRRGGVSRERGPTTLSQERRKSSLACRKKKGKNLLPHACYLGKQEVPLLCYRRGS